ncbi:hypothetical protein NPIL_267451 [Nephila pilipes]|uniref:Uncharacterized protein n=1 Tax=Nephila pilipes TaxID=299642 RepID=A0A8X6MPZ1_NEPPI|nr:hypothetical protein NPIL_267451 [Nephila pilipes]
MWAGPQTFNYSLGKGVCTGQSGTGGQVGAPWGVPYERILIPLHEISKLLRNKWDSSLRYRRTVGTDVLHRRNVNHYRPQKNRETPDDSSEDATVSILTMASRS